MPAVVGRAVYPRQRVVTSERTALALRPEEHRDVIPVRATLAENAPPYAGEIREEHTGGKVTVLLPGAQVILATLRRAWNFIGWAIDPGDAAGPLNAQLHVMTRGFPAYTAAVVVPAGRPFCLVGLVVGARCELVVSNPGVDAIHGLQGSIWGMGEK